jgi:ABC-type glycerol-3-phosphate transport system substrate-binding protein
MKNFQLITMFVFAGCAVFGIMVFSGAIPIGKSKNDAVKGNLTMWGTIDSQVISQAIEDFNRENQNIIITYVPKSVNTFDMDLLEALASGVGPDLFLLPNDLVYRYNNRIFTIPYASYPVANFKQVFATAGDVFLNSKGVVAFPLLIDPMVMYYNRGMLDSNNIINPPIYWDELQSITPSLTKKDTDGRITKSSVAFGQFFNVNNAKDILSAFFMQTGNPITKELANNYISTISVNQSEVDLGNILQFYTDFTNPTSPNYTWNRSLPNSVNAFSAEDVAFYFGFASELNSLINRNPNQNFLSAPIPQFKNINDKTTIARVTGIAVSAFTKNQSASISAAGQLATGDFSQKVANALFIAPARRDLLTARPTDQYMPIVYNSALFARSWVDPSPRDTDVIFRGMIENTVSGLMTASNAVNDAGSKINLLFNR